MNRRTVAIDLAKDVFEFVMDGAERDRLSRVTFRSWLATLSPSRVVLEVCGSAHHWARELAARGHEVVLLPAATDTFLASAMKTVEADNHSRHLDAAAAIGHRCANS